MNVNESLGKSAEIWAGPLKRKSNSITVRASAPYSDYVLMNPGSNPMQSLSLFIKIAI